MKKIMILAILLILIINGFAQEEGVYNRFRHSREEYIAVMRDLANDNVRNIDCNDERERTEINMCKTVFYSDTSSFESKRETIQILRPTNCQEVIDFYIDILKNETDTRIRHNVLECLGWTRAKSSIPFLLEVANKENDLAFVKNIARVLCVMEEFDKASFILDRLCFNEDGSVNKDCIETYAFTGKDELVKNYYLSEWEKDNDEDNKFRIALRLTEYGIYDITFSIIKENLLGTDRWKRYSALAGLGAIATEEALELIENCMDDDDIVIANYAKFVLLCLKEGRRYE